jgi:hypothetical protein
MGKAFSNVLLGQKMRGKKGMNSKKCMHESEKVRKTALLTYFLPVRKRKHD